MKYEIIYNILGSLPYLCTKIETMAPLYVATLTELPKYERASRVSALPLY